MEPTVSQSPPMSALRRATSFQLVLNQTVCRAMAKASMQQEPMQPGCCFNRVGAYVWLSSLQFQLRSITDLLKDLNLRFSSQCLWKSCSLSHLPRARNCTLASLVLKLSQIEARTVFPSASPRFTRPTKIQPINRQHSAASSPLWVVRLCREEYSAACSRLCLKAMGTGARRISEPLPLLNRSP